MYKNKSYIEELKKEFVKLYDVLYNNLNNESRYALPIVKDILDKLEGATTSNGYIFVVDEVSKSFRSMFAPKSGLSEFYIWNDDFILRKSLNENYENIIKNIERLLEEGGNFEK